MHYYLTLTTKCNLLCKYCYGKNCEDFMSEEESKKYDLQIPSQLDYDLDLLEKLEREDKDLCITFYGGEPLLRIDLIEDIMNRLKNTKFMIQTNGFFLDRLSLDYVNRFDTILVSLDGTKEHTNNMRGDGVFQRIVDNLNLIKKNGFKGEIIARMVASGHENGDKVFDNVKYLVENDFFKFESIHWQIDAQFWSNDYDLQSFNLWKKSYNFQVKKLIDFWFEDMKRNNRVLKIYPFLGIVHDLFYNIKSKMRCGAGHSLFGIQTDGKITSCPITAGYKPLYSGDLKKSCKVNKIGVDQPCSSCEILDICGGRCLYANKTKLWGENGFEQVCETVFFLVDSLKVLLPKIRDLINDGVISEKDLEFNRYNGSEIIP